MEILGQSTKATTHYPYVHLGYLAANNSVGSRGIKSSFGISCLFIITVLFMLVKRGKAGGGLHKTIKNCAAVFLIFLATLTVAGMVVRSKIYYYYPSVSISQVSEVLLDYAKEHGGKLPVAENWCDVVMLARDYNFFGFEGGDVNEGESGFALNSAVAGKNLSDLPTDIVLLFETDAGVDVAGRTGFVKDRNYFISKMSETERESSEYWKAIGDMAVYPNRWNLSGGSDILTLKYNDGKGCDVAFVDGHTEFVKTEDIPKLKWHPAPPQK